MVDESATITLRSDFLQSEQDISLVSPAPFSFAPEVKLRVRLLTAKTLSTRATPKGLSANTFVL